MDKTTVVTLEETRMEEDPAEVLVRSAENSDPVVSKLQRTTMKESILASGIETGFSSPKILTTASPRSDVIATEDPFPQESSAIVGTRSNQAKYLSESKELVPPHPPGVVDYISSDRASTSYEDQRPPDRPMGRDHMDGYVTEADVQERISPSLQEHRDSSSDRASVENHASEVTSVHISESSSAASIVSDSSVTYNSLRDDNNLQEGIPSGLGFLVSERERRGRIDGGVLHLDVVSFSSSNILSSSSPEINNREARRNSRRLFWDAFSRRSSRRHSDSRTFVFSTDDSDDSGPNNDRWLLDFNGDFFDDGIGNDNGHLGSRTDSINEQRWQSRSEIWDRLRGSRNGRDRRTMVCPSGLHPDGTACTCESVSMSEESGAHASISRIVMLAEALFEVLDEIHRQPVTLSLSMVSLPAPESVVDSLPVKYHKSTAKTGDDVDQ
ncbi:hypothetical protein LguiB_024450 [Lonicera macranthoides]